MMLKHWIVTAVLLAVPMAAQADPDGAAIYKRCAACHLATGAGVPGAFPPLDAHVGAFATNPQGRDYLVMVVSAGLSGELKVGGKSYRGIMPAQANLKPDEIAAVLNHVLQTIVKPAVAAAPFSGEDVTAIQTRHKDLKGSDVMTLRPAASGSSNGK